MNIYPFKRRKKNNYSTWKIASGAALAALAAGVIANFGNIKRYIKTGKR